MIPAPLEDLIKQLAAIPGLGRRSAQRAALYLMTKSNKMYDLQQAMLTVESKVKTCSTCGNIGLADPCHICTDKTRDKTIICVVEGVDDLWAVERCGAFYGYYHVLGGVVSAIDGISPDDVRIPSLINRVENSSVTEVIMALGASVDGQTTSHLISERLKPFGVKVSALAKGMPLGADVDYLDEGTISLALQGRQIF